MGISVWIVTGDNQATAEAVAATVGIGRGKVMAGVLPADKARKVMLLPHKSWRYGVTYGAITFFSPSRGRNVLLCCLHDSKYTLLRHDAFLFC